MASFLLTELQSSVRYSFKVWNITAFIFHLHQLLPATLHATRSTHAKRWPRSHLFLSKGAIITFLTPIHFYRSSNGRWSRACTSCFDPISPITDSQVPVHLRWPSAQQISPGSWCAQCCSILGIFKACYIPTFNKWSHSDYREPIFFFDWKGFLCRLWMSLQESADDIHIIYQARITGLR